MPKYYPVTKKKTKTIIIDGGDRDVVFPDSADLVDALVFGDGGKVATGDSADMQDKLVVSEFKIDDSAEIEDEFVASDLFLGDSSSVTDLLTFGAGGVIATADSFDAQDKLVVTEFRLDDSMDSDDSVNATTLEAVAQDSLTASDRLREVIYFTQEANSLGDNVANSVISIGESADLLTQYGDSALSVDDSLDSSSEAFLTGAFAIPDSLDAGDLIKVKSVKLPDSVSAGDARQNASFTALMYANALVSQSGMTNPANAYDNDPNTGASISITQSGGLVGGSSQTANGNIRVSCPNPNITPLPSLSNVSVQWGWTTTASGGLQSGNSVNAVIEYSLNNGTSWIHLETVTTVAGAGDGTLPITATLSEIFSLEFRATITVVSGTTLVTGGATQAFSFRYGRVSFQGVQSL